MVRSRLASKTAPRLAARHWRPGFASVYLRDPSGWKPGTTMPDLLHDRVPAEVAGLVGDLDAYLASLTTPDPREETRLNPLFVSQGRVLYHQVGCVACHPPLAPATAIFSQVAAGAATDPQAEAYVLGKLRQASVPLGRLDVKYSAQGLASFLIDPLALRPSGRMPSMNLSEAESLSIASYLLQAVAVPAAPSVATAGAGNSPMVGPGRTAKQVRRGRDSFHSLGCSACHEVEGEKRPTTRGSFGPPLAGLASHGTNGCLAPHPLRGVPRYQLTEAQRATLRLTLAAVTTWTRPPTTASSQAKRMTQLDCVACHERNGAGGPTPSRTDYFATKDEKDLGDEGRLPPHLNGVGRKLRQDWLREVLENGAKVRPYMLTRMPQFGTKNVARLVEELVALDDRSKTNAPPAYTAISAEAGRQLVGRGGLECITCHVFAGRSVGGLPAMDLTFTSRRLRWNWFEEYLRDPVALRPGTRMPAFWPDGEPANRVILGGKMDDQILAIWHYLSEGVGAKAPAGLSAP